MILCHTTKANHDAGRGTIKLESCCDLTLVAKVNGNAFTLTSGKKSRVGASFAYVASWKKDVVPHPFGGDVGVPILVDLSDAENLTARKDAKTKTEAETLLAASVELGETATQATLREATGWGTPKVCRVAKVAAEVGWLDGYLATEAGEAHNEEE